MKKRKSKKNKWVIPCIYVVPLIVLIIYNFVCIVQSYYYINTGEFKKDSTNYDGYAFSVIFLVAGSVMLYVVYFLIVSAIISYNRHRKIDKKTARQQAKKILKP